MAACPSPAPLHRLDQIRIRWASDWCGIIHLDWLGDRDKQEVSFQACDWTVDTYLQPSLNEIDLELIPDGGVGLASHDKMTVKLKRKGHQPKQATHILTKYNNHTIRTPSDLQLYVVKIYNNVIISFLWNILTYLGCISIMNV